MDSTPTPTPATTNSMTKMALLVVVLVVVAGAIFMFTRKPGTNESTPATIVTSAMQQPGEIVDTPVVEDKRYPKEFTIVGSNYAFDQPKIAVRKGDVVRITFKSGEGFHDWVLDQFNAKTKQLSSGQSETVEFIPDKVGEFEYYCSVGNHRSMGMVGTLIVTE